MIKYEITIGLIDTISHCSDRDYRNKHISRPIIIDELVMDYKTHTFYHTNELSMYDIKDYLIDLISMYKPHYYQVSLEAFILYYNNDYKVLYAA